MPTTVSPDAVESAVFGALEQFGVPTSDISGTASFADLDVDSLDLAELSQIVEERFGVVLSADDMAGIATVRDAVALVVSRGG